MSSLNVSSLVPRFSPAPFFLLQTARDKDWCQGMSGNMARVCAGSRKVSPHFRGGQENIECGGRQSESMKERLCGHS